MKSINGKFYKSREWIITREQYLKKVNHLCERCLKENKITPAYIVHHKIYLTAENYQDPNISLNMENLEALCLEHHNQEHFGKKRYKVREDGIVVAE